MVSSQKAVTAKQSEATLPTLQFSTTSSGGRNNVRGWSKAHEDHILRAFGHQLHDAVKNEVKPAFIIKNYPAGNNLAQIDAVKSENQLTLKSKQQFFQDSSKCIGHLRQHMSEDNTSRVERHAEYPSVVNHDKTMDIIKFIKIVRSTHESGAGASGLGMAMRIQGFETLKQYEKESLEVYASRYYDSLKEAQEAGYHAPNESPSFTAL